MACHVTRSPDEPEPFLAILQNVPFQKCFSFSQWTASLLPFTITTLTTSKVDYNTWLSFFEKKKNNLKISLFPFFSLSLLLLVKTTWKKLRPLFLLWPLLPKAAVFYHAFNSAALLSHDRARGGPFLLHLCSLFFATWGKLRELLVWITTRSQTQVARVSEELVQTGRPSDHLRDSAAEHPLWSCGCLICGSSTEVKNTFFATSHTLVWFLQAV